MPKPPPESGQSPRSQPISPRAGALAVGIAALLLYGIGLGRLDLWAPDEPRYAAIADELHTGHHGPSGWILLHLNGLAYTQKPPLYFWLVALTGSLRGGVDEWTARLPSALAGVASVVLVYWTSWQLYRRPKLALLASLFLATSFRFAFTARRAQLDVLLTFFELAAIALFVGLEFRSGGVENARKQPVHVALFHASLGAAALVKGPVAWLPIAVIAAYLAWEGRLRSFRALWPVWSPLLSLAPIAIWIGSAIALAPSGFAADAIGENLFGRFIAGTSHARPAYYFLYQLPLDALPWSLLAPVAAWRLVSNRKAAPDAADGLQAPPSRERSALRFTFVWLILPLLFFSLSAGKRGVYMLPFFPPLMLLLAVGAMRVRGGAQGPIRGLLTAAIVLVALEILAFNQVLPRLDPEKSPRPIAEAAARRSAPDAPIGVYGLRALEGGIRFYSGRRIQSLATPSELETFLSDPGALVVLRERHLDALGPRGRLQAIDRFRRGRRSVVIAALPPGSASNGAFPIGIHPESEAAGRTRRPGMGDP